MSQPIIRGTLCIGSPGPANANIVGILCGVGCMVLLAGKLALVWRLNINWDEFYFLSHVHELSRGELTLLLQGAYTHLFRWLAALRADEVTQIVGARVVMWLSLAVSAALIWRLAAIWTSQSIALFAPLAYLSVLPVVKHGASFRYDSLLAPLSLAVLVLLLSASNRSWKRLLAASVCFAAALAITVKAIFLAPVVIVGVFLTHIKERISLYIAAKDLVTFGVLTLLVTAFLILSHSTSVQSPPADSGRVASAMVNKTLMNVPFFPRATSYYETRYSDRLAWILLYTGVVVAMCKARYRPAAACVLSLAPILFYRNAFPYYYVVMLAPAVALVAITIDAAHRWLHTRAPRLASTSVLAALSLAFSSQGLLHLTAFRHDGQRTQEAVVAAVHQIFPHPVPYIDHSGMIASFPKVNFFMSTWGIEDYRKNGNSFMERALTHRPPLLLANRLVLDPRSPRFVWLLERDRELITTSYIQYWGPIMVAGASFELEGETSSTVRVPFPGRYRLEASGPLLLNSRLHKPGALVDFPDAAGTVATIDNPNPSHVAGRLVIASAGPPPANDAPVGELYSGL